MARARVTLTIARLCGLGALLVLALVAVAAPAPALRRAATPVLLVEVRHRTSGQPVDRATSRVRLDPRPR